MSESDTAKILIVDDTLKNIQVLGTILREKGYEIYVSRDGLQALKSLETVTPDIILLDIMMPEMDGFETCERLKASPETKDIPVIFLTAKVETEDIVKGFELGAVDYVTKPFNQTELLARVKTHLELKSTRETLKQRNQELEANVTMREDLSNMICHDIRTPLSVILGMAMITRMKTDDRLVKENIKKIERNANRVNSFLNDMLVIAKMQGGQMILTPVKADIAALVKTVHSDQSEVARSRDINLEPHQSDDHFELISIDVNLMSRVLDNLLSNAMKFSSRGDTVQIDFTKLEAEKGADASTSRTVRIDVIDQGPGIPEADHESVFEMFVTTGERDRKNTSFGLGLSFCKMVVEAHNGKISAGANEPSGTIMSIEL